MFGKLVEQTTTLKELPNDVFNWQNQIPNEGFIIY